ncbi:MAG: Gfo/Idh/MocA family oxidoreductase [Verrucomicrobiota bacterium]
MPKNLPPLTRRSFLKSTAALGAFTFLPSSVVLGSRSKAGVGPNEKINLAAIGIGNQGGRDLMTLYNSGLCNVVALCDVDMEGRHTHEARYIFGLTEKPPEVTGDQEPLRKSPQKARGFTDFRRMFDDMGGEIDAVLVATPDHSHFPAAVQAIQMGIHVFVEKPLAHTFGQCERLIQNAENHPKVVTQMGNQGFSGGNYFQFKAWYEAGIIRDITRITAHMNNPRRWHGWGPATTTFPTDPKPPGLDWELWLDCVAVNAPFSKRLHPQEWRSWYDFGGGCFGDWGPHLLDSCHHFLKLGLPEKVTPIELGGVNPSNLVYPEASTIRMDFPARGPGLPACEVTWYDGVKNKPSLEKEHTNSGEPETLNRPGKVLYGNDVVFQGNSHGSVLRIVPEEKMISMRSELPQFSQKNSNHYTNFLLACKGEEEARSPFQVSGPLCQLFCLGVISQRLGKEITFNREKKEIVNDPVASALLDPAPRKGWEQYYSM